MKTAALGVVGTSVPVASAVVTKVAEMEDWLRIATLIMGLITAMVTLYWMNRINRIRMNREVEKLCEDCVEGHQPAHCPIPVDERPVNCPLNHKRKRR